MYVMTFLQSIPTMNLIEVIFYVFTPVGLVICGIVYAWTEAKRRENEIAYKEFAHKSMSMDSTEYVDLLAEEARLEQELHAVKNRIYNLQQEMLKHYGNNAGSIVAEAELP